MIGCLRISTTIQKVIFGTKDCATEKIDQTTAKGHEKDIRQKMVSYLKCHFVRGHLSLLKDASCLFRKGTKWVENESLVGPGMGCWNDRVRK